MTEEQAIEQYERDKKSAGSGSRFAKYTAHIQRKGEPWVETLKTFKRQMKKEDVQ